MSIGIPEIILVVVVVCPERRGRGPAEDSREGCRGRREEGLSQDRETTLVSHLEAYRRKPFLRR